MLHLVSAVAVYLFFKKWEPVDIPTIFSLLVVVPSTSIVLEGYLDLGSFNFSNSWLPSFFAFYAVLLCCMMAYRLSPLHPLSQHPGPLPCKISKLWLIWIAHRGKLHTYYKSLHDTYGPIVRVGPNDLSITEKKYIPSILGSKGMPKGPMWDARRNWQLGKNRKYHALIDVRDLEVHGQLRRRWNEAFSAEPLKDYQELLVDRGEELCVHLQSLCRSASEGMATFDIGKWMSYFAFDFMGDIAFGGAFQLMSTQDALGLWDSMERSLMNQGIIQHAKWVAVGFQSVSWFSSGMRHFGQFAMKQAKRRISIQAQRKDLFYHLYESKADPSSPTSYEAQLNAAVTDSTLTIIAGSDTSASVLTGTVSLLLRHPRVHFQLLAELETAFSTVDSDDRLIIEAQKLQNLRYLNAVINEAMRLLPPVPSMLQRGPPKGSGGTTLGDNIFLPEGTGVIVPPYSIHRDERYFSPYPDAFIPERWLESSPSPDGQKFKTDREAYIPFSYGPANCAGKPLALMEVRYVIALLFTRFDWSLPTSVVQNSKNGEADAWERGLVDRFLVSATAPLTVSIRSKTLQPTSA